MLKKLPSYFFRGIILTVPIGLVVWAVVRLFLFIDGNVLLLVKSIFGIEIQGLGFILLILTITLMGYLGSKALAKPILKYIGKLINKIPLLKTIYSSIKDLLSAFVGNKKRFNQPVLVTINSSGIEKLGFITDEDLSDLGISEEKVAVYLPHSYNFSGNLFIVDKKNITIIDAKPSDVMKFIVSGGVTEMEEEQK